MIDNAGMFSISNQLEFNALLNDLIDNEKKRLDSGSNNLEYIRSNKGAVNKILKYLDIPN
jgi:3-deoxy-D-manno-octulosonic-acid transferase